jgi:hypothetical protein
MFKDTLNAGFFSRNVDSGSSVNGSSLTNSSSLLTQNFTPPTQQRMQTCLTSSGNVVIPQPVTQIYPTLSQTNLTIPSFEFERALGIY